MKETKATGENKKTKPKPKNWVMIYEINGYRYRFEKIYKDENGIFYGYCYKTRRWAWLYRDYISHYGTDIIPATRVSSKIIG